MSVVNNKYNTIFMFGPTVTTSVWRTNNGIPKPLLLRLYLLLFTTNFTFLSKELGKLWTTKWQFLPGAGAYREDGGGYYCVIKQWDYDLEISIMW